MARFEETNHTDHPQSESGNAQVSSKLLEEVQGAAKTIKNKPDKEYDLCTEGNPSISKLQQCASDLNEGWNKERRQAFVTLLKSDTSDAPGLIRRALRANEKWVDFSKKESEFNFSFYKSTPEDKAGNFLATVADAGVTRDRAIELQSHDHDTKNGSVWERIKVPFTDEATYPGKLEAALKKADRELNKTYKQLKERLDEPGQQALRKSELAWIDFRNAEFDYIQKAFVESPWKGVRNYGLAEKIDIVRARNEELQERLLHLDIGKH